jgi:hypothetical protein
MRHLNKLNYYKKYFNELLTTMLVNFAFKYATRVQEHNKGLELKGTHELLVCADMKPGLSN